VNFNQRVGRAFDRAGVAQRPQQAAHQGGLAGAEVALEPDDEARHDGLRERRAQRQRRRLSGKL